MRIFSRTFDIDCPPARRTWRGFAERIADLGLPDVPSRLLVTEVKGDTITIECSFVRTSRESVWPSLLRLRTRRRPVASPFVVVSVIPTGMRADVGGFAGDATPSTNLLATACDYLVTNPNSVTASDVYHARDNVLYLEGNLICQLMLGHLALVPERRVRLALVLEKPRDERFLNNVLNAINAIRTVAGVVVDPVVVTDSPIHTDCTYSSYGHASAEFQDLSALERAMDVVHKSSATAVALVSSLHLPDSVRQAYYRGDPIPNPWGAAEAMLTHLVTQYFPVTAAHAPLLTSWENAGLGRLVDPRDGAELISSSYVCSPLTGLLRSPRLLSADEPPLAGEQRLSVENVSALVLPESAVGNIPFLAALDQGVPVILVRGNPTQGGLGPQALGIDLDQHPIHFVQSYAEAAGLLLALRHGIAPESLARPVAPLSPIHV